MLLIAFYGKFYCFYKLFMPKLLSQSKYEEFKSNSALQIRDYNERIAGNAKKLELREIWQAAKFSQVALFILQNFLPAAAKILHVSLFILLNFLPATLFIM